MITDSKQWSVCPSSSHKYLNKYWILMYAEQKSLWSYLSIYASYGVGRGKLDIRGVEYIERSICLQFNRGVNDSRRLQNLLKRLASDHMWEFKDVLMRGYPCLTCAISLWWSQRVRPQGLHAKPWWLKWLLRQGYRRGRHGSGGTNNYDQWNIRI